MDIDFIRTIAEGKIMVIVIIGLSDWVSSIRNSVVAKD